jgi:transposase
MRRHRYSSGSDAANAADELRQTEKRTHDYVRHGTTNLFAALNTQSGEVVGRCFARRRTVGFIKFLGQVARRYPRKEIHVIVDNLSTHAGDDVDKWLEKHPRVKFHYTPSGSSWMNQVENWFGIITRQAIRRGTFQSVRQLIQHIENYISHRNVDATPFVWTATAEEIIGKVQILQRDFQATSGCQPKPHVNNIPLGDTSVV